MTSVSNEPKNVIYGLSCTCHPERGVKYVGQTCRGMRQRWHEHRHYARTGDTKPVYNWMRKHDATWTILEIHEDAEALNEAEIRLIAEHGTLVSQGGANLNEGGYGNRGYSHSEETRRLMLENRTLTNKQRTLASLEMLSRKADRARPAPTESDIEQVKIRLWNGESQTRIAKDLGVSTGMISNIYRNLTWLHVPWPIGPSREPVDRVERRLKLRGEAAPAAKLTAEKVIDIRRREAMGESRAALAAEYGVSRDNIWQIVHRKSWKHVP